MTGQQKKAAQQVSSKIIITASLKSVAPFLIGKGSSDEADVDVLLREGLPYIPASALAGCIKKNIQSVFLIEKDNLNFEYFWGSESAKDGNPNTSQSHIIFHDLLPKENVDHNKIVVRDGVRVSPETGTVAKGAKYDYQCVEPGLEFEFKAEITLRWSFDQSFFYKMTQALCYVLEHNFCVGAHTTTGFGRLECTDFKIYSFEFPDTALDWFHYRSESILPDALSLILQESLFRKRENKCLEIILDFEIKSTLIIGSNGIDPTDPDKKHLFSNGLPVLPAKSIKGALRQRALKILRVLGIPDPEGFFKDMMGWIETDISGKSKAKKSRLFIGETILEEADTHVHDRIKIDRFTGGNMDGALFNSEPVIGKKGKIFRLSLKLESAWDHEAGLLLLLLKDLWNEDLPIGGEKNIGRGVLRGEKAVIHFNGVPPITLERNDRGLKSKPEDRAQLETLVGALRNYKPETAIA